MLLIITESHGLESIIKTREICHGQQNGIFNVAANPEGVKQSGAKVKELLSFASLWSGCRKKRPSE
jgi:hypothetical protein